MRLSWFLGEDKQWAFVNGGEPGGARLYMEHTGEASGAGTVLRVYDNGLVAS